MPVPEHQSVWIESYPEHFDKRIGSVTDYTFRCQVQSPPVLPTLIPNVFNTMILISSVHVDITLHLSFKQWTSITPASAAMAQEPKCIEEVIRKNTFERISLQYQTIPNGGQLWPPLNRTHCIMM